MSDDGWIKVYRQIWENPLYFAERFTKIQAWIDLLLLTNHKPNTFYIRGNAVNLERGQTGRSILTLAERWKWNQRTVKAFLNQLQKEEMIQYRTNHVTTVITILKYETYQSNAEQTTKQNAEQSKNRMHTNKNDKNEKNEKKYSNPTLIEVKEYFKLKGYTPETASKAYDYYEANGWKDRNNKPVKNWKQKMIGVWFKPENKIPAEDNPNWK